jgi:hypothetical protein
VLYTNLWCAVMYYFTNNNNINLQIYYIYMYVLYVYNRHHHQLEGLVLVKHVDGQQGMYLV